MQRASPCFHLHLMTLAARLLGFLAAAIASLSICDAGSSFIDFRSVDGQLKADDETFHIKGINWFGGGASQFQIPIRFYPIETANLNLFFIFPFYSL